MICPRRKRTPLESSSFISHHHLTFAPHELWSHCCDHTKIGDRKSLKQDTANNRASRWHYKFGAMCAHTHLGRRCRGPCGICTNQFVLAERKAPDFEATLTV